MGDYEDYIEEQEKRQRELESKIDLVRTRAGMTEDAGERAVVQEQMAELGSLMKQFAAAVAELRDAGSAWRDMRDSIEKVYRNVKVSLRKGSGGLVK